MEIPSTLSAFHITPVCVVSIQACEKSSLCTYSAIAAFNKVKYYVLRLLFVEGMGASQLFPVRQENVWSHSGVKYLNMSCRAGVFKLTLAEAQVVFSVMRGFAI